MNCDKNRPLPLEGGNEIVETVILQPENEDFYYSVKKNLGSSTQLLLGKAGDEYSSRVLLKFTGFPDSMLVDSASIILYSRSILGDSSSSFQVNMYGIQSDWDPFDVVNWGDGVMLDSTSVISTADISPFTPDTVVFDIPADIAQSWVDSTTGDSNGVWIDCGNATFIKSFYSANYGEFSVSPRLDLTYHTPANEDTSINYSAYSNQDAFVLSSNLNLDEDLLYVGKGISFYSYLTFDIASELDSTASINKADLELIINRDYSIFDAAGAAEIGAMRVSSQPGDHAAVEIDSAFTGYFGSVLEDTISISVRPLIQTWSKRDPGYENFGFLLRSANETETLSRIALYSSRADSLRKPKLIIKYTLPPTQDYF
jgi:hypothetical protein